MPTILGYRYPPTFDGYPPRMSAEDYQIWQRYWPQVKAAAQGIYFDVGLGLPDELPETDDAAQLLGWIRNTQKRCDVLIEREEAVHLVELRFNAQLNAIGRLQGYMLLITDDNPFRKPIIPFLVTNRPDSEVERLCRSQAITYLVV